MNAVSPANKAVIFYHANCVDGFAAAHVIERHIIENTSLPQTMIPVKHGEIETVEDFNKHYAHHLLGSEIFIVDFSFPSEVMGHVAEMSTTLYWLDHHKTAFEAAGFDINKRYDLWAGPNFYLVLDNSKCGAMLAWEFVNGGRAEAPDFIKVVDDYDRWVFQYPQTKDAQMYIRSHSMNRPAFDSLMLMSMDEMAQADRRDSDSPSQRDRGILRRLQSLTRALRKRRVGARQRDRKAASPCRTSESA